MFTGSAVALITPFTDKGEVNFDALGALIDFHAAQGTDAVLVCGTTGESATLSHDEHNAIIDFAAKHMAGPRGSAGKPYLIAGTGSNSTKEAIDLTVHAAEAGVDAALVITPYYNKPTQPGLVRHFTAVAEAAPRLPIITYSVPGRTGVTITVDTTVELSRIPNIIGIKEASGDLEAISEMIRLTPDGFDVWSGEDAITWPICAMGGRGAISVTANVAPALMHEFATAAATGDCATATRLHHRLFPLHKAMFAETNPIPAKLGVQLLHEAGVEGVPATGGLRPPLYWATDATRERVGATLRDVGVLS